MPAITLDAIEAKQTELSKLIAQLKEDARKPVLHCFAAVEVSLRPGDHYAGPVLNASGAVQHQLVLLDERPTGKLNWQAAKDWASSVGGVLPTRQELALIYANCKPHLQPVWHWSCEEHEDDASYAWLCTFLSGGQLSNPKSYEGGVVAVRRFNT